MGSFVNIFSVLGSFDKSVGMGSFVNNYKGGHF
jgi:hypothetical protein